ncbi:MAG: hypothetical protein FD137_2483 [Spirochaetes bacterium]|nr:MAG: hypothetical protein FD137_2483 [Spirochaetota bacterium]
MNPKNFRSIFIFIPLALACASVSAQPFNMPKTISAADRLAADLAKPGLDYNVPVSLKSPGWEKTRCATMEIAPDAFVDVWWPAEDLASPTPVVLWLVSQSRTHFLGSTGRPMRNYPPVVSMAANIASKGMIVVVPDFIVPTAMTPRLLDWIESAGPSLGMDPKRMAWYTNGYGITMLPSLLAQGYGTKVRALALMYTGWLKTSNVTLPGGMELLYVRAGKGSYWARCNAYMGTVVEDRKKAGLPTEFIDLPQEFAYFDWLKDNEEVREVLSRVVDFLEARLRQ